MNGEEEPGKGLGAMWEGSLILAEMYYTQPVNEKFIPVLPPSGHAVHIPEIIQSVTRYAPFDDAGYDELYRRLTNQSATPPSLLGPVRRMPPQPVRGRDASSNAAPQAQRIPSDAGRLALLEEMTRASRARCLERWQANGLSRAQAEELFDDSSLGAMGVELLGSAPPLTVVIGELGAGKSLLGERFLQVAIRRASTEIAAPVPVCIPARAAAGRLHEVARVAAREIGDPRIVGAAVVVDGLDEAGVAEAEGLLREARILAETWPYTNVVLTSRPLPPLDQPAEQIDAPLLTDEEASALMGRIAGRQLPEGYALSLPPSVRSAVWRPLFAVLVGVYLRERAITYPRSAADLLDTLVKRAVGRSTLDRSAADSLLHRLAVASTDRGGAAIPATEVGTRSEVAQLLDTRLVVERDRALDFSLPLLTQWFAAQALVAGAVSPDDLARDLSRLERWRYPLSVLVGTMGHDTVTHILSPVVIRAPALASVIVHDALLEQHGRRDEVHLPPAEECGQRLHNAMSAWVRGTGPLAPYISPVRADGTAATVATAVGTQGDLMVSWYRGIEALPDVVPLSQHYKQDTAWRDGWPELRIAQPVAQSAWAWRWTFDKLAGELKEVVEGHRLPPPVGSLRDEAIWRLALKLKGDSSLGHTPITIMDLETSLIPFARSERVIFYGMRIDPRMILSLLAQLRAAGEDAIHPPWPSPDIAEEEQRPGWVWSPYSDAQLLARTQAVCAAALEGYKQIVAGWFPAFAPRLSTMGKLPARVVGELVRADNDQGYPPTFWSRWEPLPQGAKSEVVIELSDGTNEDMKERGYPVFGWSAVLLFEDTPATDLAYGWLANDLRGVQWL